jgi:hypothetical protein
MEQNLRMKSRRSFEPLIIEITARWHAVLCERMLNSVK